MRDPDDKEIGRLLRFLNPALLHGMSNALFAVTNHARLLGGGETEIARERAAILRAAGGGAGVLDVVRFALGEVQQRPTVRQAGMLVRQACDLLRVSCRDHGLRVKASHSSVDSPANVDAVQLCRALFETVRELVDGLPSGYSGTLDVDLLSQGKDSVVLSLGIAHDRDLLPFPLDLARVVSAARRAIDDDEVVLERVSTRQLTLRVRALRDAGPREELMVAVR
ncbi:MAG TPA: hypothetical protein VK081_09220 [Planctomycetota bacterium]|nr:hypothetical protein [Planctomycetota bacterium]